MKYVQWNNSNDPRSDTEREGWVAKDPGDNNGGIVSEIHVVEQQERSEE